MEQFINDNKVINSGAIVVVEEQRLRICLSDDFKVDIGFVYSGDSPNQIHSEIRDGVLFISFSNFRVVTSNRAPMRLGTYRGHPIFLNYAINFIGDDNHHSIIFHYSFFVEEHQG